MADESKQDKAAWAGQTFEGMKSLESPRVVELPEDDSPMNAGDHASFTEQVEHSPKLSDVGIIAKQLYPDLGIEWLTRLEVARVLPQYYDHLKFICVTELIRNYRKPVAEAIALTEIAVGLPLDGEARIEGIALLGRAETSEEAKAKNSMGLPS